MPKRSNEKQKIIVMLKELLAGPDTTVTESKLLWDKGAEAWREVDVVVEIEVDGRRVVASYEVTNIKNPVDVMWTEQLLAKHERMDSDRLYLVPWGGVTAMARTLVANTPWASFVEPLIVNGPDGPVVQNIFADLLALEPKVVLAAIERGGEDVVFELEADTGIYNREGKEVEPLSLTVHRMLATAENARGMLKLAHEHPTRDALNSFLIGARFNEREIFLRYTDEHGNVELHCVKAIEVRGATSFSQSPLRLELRTFAEDKFLHGRADFDGFTSLAVATLGEDGQPSQIRLRFDPAPPTKAVNNAVLDDQAHVSQEE
jgi:hypothetical protein